MSLFFISLKTRHLEYWLKKIEKKGLNEWKTTTTNKKILNGCTPCLFTMKQEDQSFDKALLWQNN